MTSHYKYNIVYEISFFHHLSNFVNQLVLSSILFIFTHFHPSLSFSLIFIVFSFHDTLKPCSKLSLYDDNQNSTYKDTTDESKKQEIKTILTSSLTSFSLEIDYEINKGSEIKSMKHNTLANNSVIYAYGFVGHLEEAFKLFK